MAGIAAERCNMKRMGPSAGNDGRPGGGTCIRSWAATGEAAANKSSRMAEKRMDQLLVRDAGMMARLAAAVTPANRRRIRAAKYRRVALKFAFLLPSTSFKERSCMR
ncbi:hypothetical protein [Sandarakinorhabdus limnophila]|uniref:hypothetical protein n=1 Tax=Sandarakinorhabdus limnophila TaxID=210512 RepID=UPI0023530B35|nr:hypothetical protein [Sandarakinorhabdus limnophila]